MTKLLITTPYGKTYTVDEQGRISHSGYAPSGQWIMLGIVHVKRSTHFIPLADLLKGRLPASLTYKNGNPEWTIRDRDHGTIREWGNTKHHGIRSIEIIKEKA